MKLTPDSAVTRGRSLFEGLNSRGKANVKINGQQEMCMGDLSVPSNSSANSHRLDSVCCWGDVPKQPTRAGNLMEPINQDSSASLRSTAAAVRHDRIQSNNSSNATSMPVQVHKLRQSDQDSKPSDDSNSANKTKPDGTAGREKLLEWLRASQAKRDENNRLVFSRWIDRAMNNQVIMAPNAAATTLTTMEGIVPMDYQYNPTFPVLSTFPGLLSAPNIMCSGPLGLGASANMPGNPLLAGGATGFNHSFPSPWWPTTYLDRFTLMGTNTITPTQASSLIESTPPGTNIGNVASDSSVSTSLDSPCICPVGLNPNHSTHQPGSTSTSYKYDHDHFIVKQGSCVAEDSYQSTDESIVVNQATQHVNNSSVMPPALAASSTSSSSNAYSFAGGMQPDTYYTGTPLHTDSGYSHMLYYYCYQIPLMNTLSAPHPSHSAVIQQQTFATGSKGPTVNQPFIYFVPSTGTAMPYSPLGQPPFMLQTYNMCSSQLQSIQDSSTLSNPVHQHGHMMEPAYTESPKSGSHLVDAETKSGSPTVFEQKASPGSILGARLTTTLGFDIDKWYKTLHDTEGAGNVTTDSDISVRLLSEENRLQAEV